MKLALILGILLVSVILISGGCAKKETAQDTDITTKILLDLTVSEAVEKLRKAGLELGEEKDAFPQIYSADDGTKLDVNGVEVDIYYFGKGKEKIKESFKEVLKVSDQTFEARGLLFIIHSKDEAVGTALKEALK